MAQAKSAQLLIEFNAVRNSDLFSNHWLENRLPLEPEWMEVRAEAYAVIESLTELWKVQKNRVEKYDGEQMLEEQFIQPVLRALGWKDRMLYQTFLRGRKPDYALFLDAGHVDAALAKGKNHPDFWQNPVMVADAKAWAVSLDRKATIESKREYPPEQIEWYLNNSQLDYAILTNGRLWRLVPRQHDPGQARFQTYLEVDLPKLLDARLEVLDAKVWPGFDDFLRFFLFFSPEAHRGTAERPSLIRRARAGSSEYRLGVGEGLKQRVFDALSLSIEGFVRHAANQLTSSEADIELCRQQSFTLLYRLLFVLFAEDRKLLPYGIDRAYTDNRSLGRFRDEIAKVLDRIDQGRDVEFPESQVQYWPDLLSLFDLIDGGAARYRVPAYNGGLFDSEQHPFLRDKVLPDRYLARVIDRLSRAPDPNHPDLGLFRVDYRDLAIQHLGNVYEGLLELRPKIAESELVVIRSGGARDDEEKYLPAGEPMPKGYEASGQRYEKGAVYLVTDKGERRASGSYYTPDHVVSYLVEQTLGAICEGIDLQLVAEIEEVVQDLKRARGEHRTQLIDRLEALRGDFDDRLLRLRVLDPSMGSGHFLIRACQYLAEQIATNPHAKDDSHAIGAEESTLVYWKRRVAESCLYGVDLNSMAVELAKLALWLETVSVNQPLTFLDHHLRHGNSLVGTGIESLGVLPGTELLSNRFEQQVKQRLPRLLDALSMIRRTPSDTVEQVKGKDKLFRRTFEPVRQPFLLSAHAWCSFFFAKADERLNTSQYDALIDALAQPKKFETLASSEPYARAIRASGPNGIAAFHWELEFPEVFFGEAGYRSDPGFDAIIGNPPYDVLSEKETGRDLGTFKAFIDRMDIYEPSKVGKNNLYKLFICRALNLLADGGRLGFITPMAVLGDEQASAIRAAIFRQGTFTFIEAFPQKDDPSRRVFRDAKLSTAAFIVIRSRDDAIKQTPIISRIHPASLIEKDSPTLRLSAASVPLYDPKNLTIVSCAQIDWDLATRITAAGQLSRLGEFVEFFQGEVNETIQKAKGNLVDSFVGGKLVTRGASVCLYMIRLASQGEDLFLDIERFTRSAISGSGKRKATPDAKALHFKHRRVVLQESSPQNNFRRVISAILPAGEFCNHTINYAPEHKSRLPLEFVVGLLNTKLIDWYFRLGSTNAHVSQYQLGNLPCPSFTQQPTEADDQMLTKALTALRAGRWDDVLAALSPGLISSPHSTAVRETIVEAVKRIMAIESGRGDIARTERSALASKAQPYQDLIDRLFYRMAGLTNEEVTGLEERLARML